MNRIDVVSQASNVRAGSNPPFVLDDFLLIYPQFGKNDQGVEIIPEAVIEMYIEFAHECIKKSRWHKTWQLGMCLFVAHFCTLWLQSFMDPNHGAHAVMKAAETRGLVTSKSVGDLSVNYDFSAAMDGLDGWAGWKLTAFGAQFATFAKMLGRGGMYIW